MPRAPRLLRVFVGLAMVTCVGVVAHGVLRSKEAPPADAPPVPANAANRGAAGPAGPARPVGPPGPVAGGAAGNVVGPSGNGRVFTNEAPNGRLPDPGDGLCVGCDVVVISVCSLRRDHVGVYGEVSPSLTPAMDGLARDGWFFEEAYAAGNFTLAGLTAILTGRFGSGTGVVTWDKGLTQDIPTLPEVLGIYGYRTAAFTTDAPSGFRPDYGLDRGFQYMELIGAPFNTPDGRWSRKHQGGGAAIEEGDGATAKPAAAWLSKQPTEQPLFLMMHTRTAHYPFVISDAGAGADETGMVRALWVSGHEQAAKQGPLFPGQAGGTDVEGVVDIGGKDPVQVLVNNVGQPAVDVLRREYRRAVARTDVDIRTLVEAQERRGRADRTIWLLVADHGESLNDHGELLHGGAFFDSVINVPLLMRVPGIKGSGRIKALVSHVDILPTLLELVGAKPPAGIDGVSMWPVMSGAADKVRDIALSEGGVMLPNPKRLPGAVLAPPWILLRHDSGCDLSAAQAGKRAANEPPACLYDTRTDPGQTTVVSHDHPEVVRALLDRWEGYRQAAASEARQLELDPAFVDELHRTGYDFRPPPR